MLNLHSAESFGNCLALFIWYSLAKPASIFTLMNREEYHALLYIYLQIEAGNEKHTIDTRDRFGF